MKQDLVWKLLGKKLICKEYFFGRNGVIFYPNRSYLVIGHSYQQICLQNDDLEYWFDKEKTSYEYVFSKFYSEKEMRKMKLEKISVGLFNG